MVHTIHELGTLEGSQVCPSQRSGDGVSFSRRKSVPSAFLNGSLSLQFAEGLCVGQGTIEDRCERSHYTLLLSRLEEIRHFRDRQYTGIIKVFQRVSGAVRLTDVPGPKCNWAASSSLSRSIDAEKGARDKCHVNDTPVVNGCSLFILLLHPVVKLYHVQPVMFSPNPVTKWRFSTRVCKDAGST